MTVEERLARLEVRADGNDAWLKSIDEKVDRLIAVTNMGQGALLLLLKVGGVMAAIAAAVAWVFDKIHK